jgi:hypothetical protein
MKDLEENARMKERLAFIKDRISKKGIAAFYAWYNPKAEFSIDTHDATEDILWMIAEIERLRVENNDLKSPRFSDFLQKQLRKKLLESDSLTDLNKKRK